MSLGNGFWSPKWSLVYGEIVATRKNLKTIADAVGTVLDQAKLGFEAMDDSLYKLHAKVNRMEKAVSSITQTLIDIKANLREAGEEYVAKLDELANAIENKVSEEDLGLITELKDLAKGLADKVPNAPAGTGTEDEDGDEDEGDNAGE